MLEPRPRTVPISLRGRMPAAGPLLRARRAEIMAAVARQAEAGSRAAMRIARKHGLAVEPPPDVLAARLAESIKRTRATVAALLAEGGIYVCRYCGRRAGAALRRSERGVELVNINENTSEANDGDAASRGEQGGE
jgi:hypothetical protein